MCSFFRIQKYSTQVLYSFFRLQAKLHRSLDFSPTMAPVDPLAPPNTGNLLANNRPVVMTELGLFPRGKSSVAQVPSPGSATSHNNANFKGQHSEDVGKHGGKKAGHKRKAPGASSPGAAAGGDKDWLFGSPQQLKGARISGSSMRKSPLSDGTTGGSRIRGDKVKRETCMVYKTALNCHFPVLVRLKCC